MRYRLPWDRAERLFSRGQRLLIDDHREQALECFERAIAIDPDYPQLHLHRGLALSRLGRYEDALAACRRAVQLQPSNAAFHLYVGFVHMDHGFAREALASLAEARAREPQNAAVPGALLLAQSDLDDAAARAQLVATVNEFPDCVRSRLAARIDDARGTVAARAGDEAPPPPRVRSRPRGVGWILGAMRARRLRAIDNAMRTGKYEKALARLSRESASGDNDVEDRRIASLAAVCRTLRQQLNEVPRDADTERRRLLFQLASYLVESGKVDESHTVLSDWNTSFVAAASPSAEHRAAGAVLTEMAEIELQREEFASARLLAYQARALAPQRQQHLIAARAERVLGNLSAAQYLYGRYLRADLSFLDDLVEQAGTHGSTPRL